MRDDPTPEQGHIEIGQAAQPAQSWQDVQIERLHKRIVEMERDIATLRLENTQRGFEIERLQKLLWSWLTQKGAEPNIYFPLQSAEDLCFYIAEHVQDHHIESAVAALRSYGKRVLDRGRL